MQIPFDNEILKNPCLVTFKIHNSGRECIKLPEDSNPPLITFKKGVIVLGWDNLETVPSHVEVIPKLNREDFLLVVPILNPKESIKLRVLLNDYIDALPEEIDARIPAKKRIVVANNIRSSHENRIAAIVCMASLFNIYGLYKFDLNFNNINDIIRIILLVLITLLIGYAGICLFQLSRAERRMFPISYPLHSDILRILFKQLLIGMPFIFVLGAIAALIYILFGEKGLALSFLVLCFLLCCYLPIRAKYIKRLTKADENREEARKM